jgi:hypothetical protein
MVRLILIVILVVIIFTLLLRRKQPPPPLVEIHPLEAKNEARPALGGGEKGREVEDLRAGSGDSISEEEGNS